MIFVTLGTQDKSFTRLLEAVEDKLQKGTITDEVVVQAGYTKFQSQYMKIFDYMEKEDFESFMSGCDILITHGGVGSIMTGLNAGKRVIAAARLREYGEHTNDHQLQIIDKFEKQGYLIALKDFALLDQAIETAKNTQIKKFQSNTGNIIDYLENYIDNI